MALTVYKPGQIWLSLEAKANWFHSHEQYDSRSIIIVMIWLHLLDLRSTGDQSNDVELMVLKYKLI